MVALVAIAAAAACGDASDDGPGGGGGNEEGGSGTDGPGQLDPDGTAGGDGSPIDPGGPDGGGPTPLDSKCPSLTMPAGAASVYVDANAGGGGTGTKAAPFKTVAQAFAGAGANGVIWITAGTYKETLTVPNKGLAVYGGFAAGFGSRTDACATILEAGSASQAVLSAGASVKSFTLDGLTVQKGARGLAVSGDSSIAPLFTISNAVFAENGQTSVEGGGASFDRANAKITRSVFRDNRAAKGAAVLLVGDLATITIDGSLFEKNIGHSDHGGGLYLSPKSGTVTRSTFRGNEIGRGINYGWGGAVIVFKAGAAPVKTDFAYNVFTDNLAGVGGAVFVDDGATITMSHDLIYRNRSYRENGVARGGALYADGLNGPSNGSTLIADHLTVAFNDLDETGQPAAMTRGGGVFVETYSKVTFTSSIFWKNGNEPFYGVGGTTSITVSHSIAPAACGGGAACTIGAGVFQPTAIEFADEAANDFHEKSVAGRFSKGAWVTDTVTSPAVDKADPAATPGSEPAPNGGRANLGAYGRTAEASKSP